MSATAANALWLWAAFTALWALSVRLKDTSIIDVAWGPAIASTAWVALWLGPGSGPRAWAAALLGAAWGLRLGGYLAVRARGRGEDARYARMRAEHGEAWPRRSLVTVFWLQAALAWVISLPLQWAGSSGGVPAWTPWDTAGALAAAAGTLFEAAADAQLQRFKRAPENRGQVMDRGLWRYSRHPNYFGECVAGWGFWLLALGAGHGWAALPGPALLTFLLLRVSGVTLLEAHLAGRPGYADYVARTSPFVPLPPRRR